MNTPLTQWTNTFTIWHNSLACHQQTPNMVMGTQTQSVFCERTNNIATRCPHLWKWSTGGLLDLGQVQESTPSTPLHLPTLLILPSIANLEKPITPYLILTLFSRIIPLSLFSHCCDLALRLYIHHTWF